MSFNKQVGGPIDLSKASTWTQAFRNANPTEIMANAFGSDILNDILGQSGCEGIRFYNAINDANEKTLVIVGVDSNGDDMTTGTIGDFALPCPDSCGVANSAQLIGCSCALGLLLRRGGNNFVYVTPLNWK